MQTRRSCGQPLQFGTIASTLDQLQPKRTHKIDGMD